MGMVILVNPVDMKALEPMVTIPLAIETLVRLVLA